MQVLTIVVAVSTFKIFKVFKLSYLQNNGLKSFCCYVVCVVAVGTICMVTLGPADLVCKIIQVGNVCCALATTILTYNTALNINHAYVFIH
jgi:hypothetical protein